MLRKPGHPVIRISSAAPVVFPESLNGREEMRVGLAQVSPPAATAEGLTGALAPDAIKLIDKRISDTILDRIVMFPTLGIDVRSVRAPSAERYNAVHFSSRIAAILERPRGPRPRLLQGGGAGDANRK